MSLGSKHPGNLLTMAMWRPNPWGASSSQVSLAQRLYTYSVFGLYSVSRVGVAMMESLTQLGAQLPRASCRIGYDVSPAAGRQKREGLG